MKKRKTIGVMINGLDGNYLTYFWIMVKKAAEKFDCNLIVYEGRALQYNKESNGKHSIVYGFVDKNRIDGLIMTSSAILSFVDEKNYDKFCNRYKDIPKISIGKVIPYATSLLINNKEGMRSLIKHLIEFHNYKKIAFVKGPKNNQDAIERYEAYVEVLEESKISIDSSLVFEGDFISRTGYELMIEIIKKEIEYDVIVFSNDDMALGALKALKEMEGIVKFDYSKKSRICGFDDSFNSSLTTPALTTVRQPIEELCYAAFELLIDKINGESIKDIVTFPSVLVKRESCGCKYKAKSNLFEDSYLRLVPTLQIHENIQTYSLEDLYNKVTGILKLCHIRRGFISTYEDGIIMFDDSFLFKSSYDVPKRSELKYAFCDGVKLDFIEEDIKYFNTKDIVPDCFIPHDRRFVYLVNPLFFNTEHFGFLCVEVVNDDVLEFEPLRGQVSNSLKGAIMLMEREKMEKVLLESERLASLGQLIGGISHNLMTPIMSISGVCTAMEDLINEYKESLDDPDVTIEDHHEISREMKTWIERLREFNSYMSTVITTVKRQAIQLNSEISNEFTIDEFLSKVDFVINNNIKFNKCNFSINTSIDKKTQVKGDLANLIQIIDNLILNAIQSYDETDKNAYRVDMFLHVDGNYLVIKVRDYGSGIALQYKDKIFKHMTTSKGKEGTGLSLLLSYSTIKGKFGGEIWFEDAVGGGTEFNISIPLKK
ncbi:UNVERIFIED_CONTAM: DNA-binding LacI/PurR family transcriptional regulator [Acetivibrio alkalicellulosi]